MILKVRSIIKSSKIWCKSSPRIKVGNVTFAPTLHILGHMLSGFIKRIATELLENSATTVPTQTVAKSLEKNHNLTSTSEFIETRKGLPASTVSLHSAPKQIWLITSTESLVIGKIQFSLNFSGRTSARSALIRLTFGDIYYLLTIKRIIKHLRILH